MRSKEKQAFLEDMITEIKEIPVEDIVGSEIELFPKGRYYLGLCPFHPDNRLGSFVVTPDKNLWWCFACGKGGNGISFIMEYYEVTFLQACFKLALDYGIITQEQAENYSRKKFDPELMKHIERETLSSKEVEKPPVAEEQVIHLVYGAMASVCGLSDAHKKHLLEERRLSETELADFFTFPTRRTNLCDKVLEEIKKQYFAMYQQKKLPKEQCLALAATKTDYVASQLPIVPGFYRNSSGVIDFVSFKGIGFVIRDAKRRIKGIQIRRDVVKPQESRYIWFSSSFASKIEGCHGGAPSGSPGGYVAPKTDIAGTTLAITEGRFKAEAIAEMGNPVVYVSGVSTWRSILPMLEQISIPSKKVCLMFDADILGNVAVYEQLTALGKALVAKGYAVSVLLWDKRYGKGFDDMKNALGKEGVKQCCSSVAFRKFEDVYQKTLQETFHEFHVSVMREIKKEEVQKFCERLELRNLEAFQLKKGEQE